eukprot:TRINITY_DN5698_c0_g3_i3.p1 TRINITY_DN5698_c0_g3~~TRINITY_DN5698_c0_g3_i3.p1  ORF type:complete len:1313 (+),score=251.70 TRINITY_DN5698_c0_g3_i3:557-3940(+)
MVPTRIAPTLPPVTPPTKPGASKTAAEQGAGRGSRIHRPLPDPQAFYLGNRSATAKRHAVYLPTTTAGTSFAGLQHPPSLPTPKVLSRSVSATTLRPMPPLPVRRTQAFQPPAVPHNLAPYLPSAVTPPPPTTRAPAPPSPSAPAPQLTTSPLPLTISPVHPTARRPSEQAVQKNLSHNKDAALANILRFLTTSERKSRKGSNPGMKWRAMSQRYAGKKEEFQWDSLTVLPFDIVAIPANVKTFECVNGVIDDEETHFFQYRVQCLDNLFDTHRSSMAGVCEAKVDTTPLPSIIPDVFPATFFFACVPSEIPSVQRMCFGDKPASAIIPNALKQAHIEISGLEKDLVLNITGTTEYVLNMSTPLRNLQYVRECLFRHRSIMFTIDVHPTAQRQTKSSAVKAGQLLHSTVQCYPINQISKELLVLVLGVDDADAESLREIKELKEAADTTSNVTFSVVTGVYYGSEKISRSAMETQSKTELTWFEWLHSGISYNKLSLETRLTFMLVARPRKHQAPIPLGWSSISIFDHNGIVRQGLFTLSLWPYTQAPPFGTFSQNPAHKAVKVIVEMPTTPHPIIYNHPTQAQFTAQDRDYKELLEKPPQNFDAAELEQALVADPLNELTGQQKFLLWKYRHSLRLRHPACLPKFLQSVQWHNPEARLEALKLLDAWVPLSPVDALVLLDGTFVETCVRRYAVSRLEHFTDEQLADFLLPLVQALKYEVHHFSALAVFLLGRAVRNKVDIGHFLFWYLQSEMHVKEYKTRFGLLISAYLWVCGDAGRSDLIAQVSLAHQLNLVQQQIVSSSDRKRLASLLSDVLPGNTEVYLPTNPKMRVKELNVDRCRCLNSAQAPLWLSFSNADPFWLSPVCVIFKNGDDLRQDCLTLHTLNIMVKLWKDAGLDLQMTTYKCVPTGATAGFIEVVPDAITTAKIQKVEGVTGALQKTPLQMWMKQNNSDERCYSIAVQNFVVSCAGYCVATYILGIGDRHNDNIMVDKSGHIFHIDFANFLGNTMKFGPYEREKAPFVLTPEFVYFMGGIESDNFALYIGTCCQAFNILRTHADIFFNIFKMMLNTGLAQLSDKRDLLHLRNTFSVELSEREANTKFIRLITESLSCTTTLINFLTHNIVHWNH